ncbi:MAG TPA: methyltransferase, partial [Rhodospirillaceae bacterium]|nr:methyltransferase [Rhodospirillaceae bacterium]
MTDQTTLDKLLHGRFTIEQPAKGYRIAVDTLLLASSVPAQESHHILDLGCGAGGIMLALATRLRDTYITGLEIQTKLVTLCKSNIQRNAYDESLDVREGDATQLDDSLKEQFDHVVMNPPFHDAARHDSSPNASKRQANTQKTGELEAWIVSAHQALKEEG